MSSGPSYTSMNGHHIPNGSASYRVPTPSGTIAPHPDFRQAYHTNGYSQNIYQEHDQKIVNHLYENGFKQGEYADILLHVHQNVYRLHALILSRSPFLVHLMSTSPQVNGLKTIDVQLDREPEITLEGFYIALGYLYSSHSLHAIQPHNARAVLAAGCLLGGMEELCEYAYETCKRSISVDTINSWLEFIDKLPATSSGTETPDVSPISVFGFYAQRIRDDIFHFLVVTLPEILELHSTPNNGTPSSPEPTGREVLLQVFSRVPFEMFKAAVESPNFQIDVKGSDQARFKFAKEAIEARKRGIARGSGCEETVVLAFGGGNSGGSAVHITRKMRKRPLWKVNS
ncbi:hypothetical protein K435DRAFT_841334 [Dendrothele bispora CBS 962.96]|uniref:BTB domain-containing protein n=1 Tax=Dendrothele bispora (strain CBS 962.96) TaxID=1314807 RepID=A0A4S8LNH1_DENBC|nr:hypothetical protein K435DRAFT_841334 [Dendrothele bispora CBS 962.96]